MYRKEASTGGVCECELVVVVVMLTVGGNNLTLHFNAPLFLLRVSPVSIVYLVLLMPATKPDETIIEMM